MDSIINYEIYEKLENAKGGRKSRPLFDENEKMDYNNQKIAKFNEIKNFILDDTEKLKLFMVLAIKKITWRKELENKFDIHPTIITNFFNYTKRQGLILFKPFTEVENLLFNTVVKQNTNAFYAQRELVKVYTLSPDGEFIAQKISDEIFKLSNSRLDIKIILDEIMKKTEIHRKTLLNYYEKENTFNYVGFTMPDGLYYETESLKSKKFSSELNKSLLELKKEILHKKEIEGIATSKEKQQLMELKNRELVLVNKPEISKYKKNTYSGMYSHLNDEDLNKLISGVSKEEEKSIEKEYALETKEKIKTIWNKKKDVFIDSKGNQHLFECKPLYLSNKGLRDLDEMSWDKRADFVNANKSIKTEDEKCLDFLNSL